MSIDCYCDYDMPDYYRAKIRRARKEHHCYECGRTIKAGEQYEDAFGVYRGESTYHPKTCERCVNIRIWVTNNVPCFCWSHGNMIEDAKDAVDEACFRAPLETVGLRFGLLRRLHQERRP